jgi:hypothetical protein
MNRLPTGMRIAIQIILIMLFVQWTKSGENAITNQAPQNKKSNGRMRKLVIGEAYTNCTCPKDSPVDTEQEYCGYEILERTGPSNPCENHTVYRCMDPDPWKAIDHIPCAHYGERNSDRVHQKCDKHESRHPSYRQCV